MGGVSDFPRRSTRFPTVSTSSTPLQPVPADADPSADLMTTALSTAAPASKGKIISWAMWDWGTQPFNTVITTFVFSVYITSASFGSENQTSQSLAISTTIAGLFIALLAPVLGQNSDRRCLLYTSD